VAPGLELTLVLAALKWPRDSAMGPSSAIVHGTDTDLGPRAAESAVRAVSVARVYDPIALPDDVVLQHLQVWKRGHEPLCQLWPWLPDTSPEPQHGLLTSRSVSKKQRRSTGCRCTRRRISLDKTAQPSRW
jgi:hypothetical protein